MKSLFNFNFVYHIVLLNDRTTHTPSLVMMLKLGKKISVGKCAFLNVLSIYIYNEQIKQMNLSIFNMFAVRN